MLQGGGRGGAVRSWALTKHGGLTTACVLRAWFRGVATADPRHKRLRLVGAKGSRPSLSKQRIPILRDSYLLATTFLDFLSLPYDPINKNIQQLELFYYIIVLATDNGLINNNNIDYSGHHYWLGY